MDICKNNVNNTPRLLRIHPSQEGTNNLNKHRSAMSRKSFLEKNNNLNSPYVGISGRLSWEGNKKFN